MRTCIVPYRRKDEKKNVYLSNIILYRYRTMNNNIGIYACTCGVIIRNGGGGGTGAQGVGSRTQKESHEPTTPSLGRNARASPCVVHARQNGRRHTYRRPPARAPSRTPAFPGPGSTIRPPGRVDGFRSQGGCDARYTRPVAPIGPTAFPSATAAAATAAARPYLVAGRRSESTDR